MGIKTFLLAALVGLSSAAYTLEDDYVSGGNFFSLFSFFTAADPTHGFVQYVDQGTAQSAGYINETSSSVYIGTDYHNVASSSGRQSVRITSNKAYNAGTLIVLDLAHMPGGECGTWPAFWTVGPNWPNSGEIDIIEGVNSQTTDSMTLHSSSGCSITNNGAFSGTIATSNCDINAAGQATNAGCGISNTNTQTYGAGFNAVGGGVYAMDFEASAITIYFFPRGAIPSDINSGLPNPSGWGTPVAQFQGACDIPSHFNSQQIVFDLTYCGDWAGAVWSTDAVCAPLASTCNAYVQNNPSAFQSAYWQINSLKTYQYSANSVSSSSTSTSSTRSTTSTSTTSTTAPTTTSTTTSTRTTSSSSTTSTTTTSSTSTTRPTSTTSSSSTTSTSTAAPTTTSRSSTTTSTSAAPTTTASPSTNPAPVSSSTGPITVSVPSTFSTRPIATGNSAFNANSTATRNSTVSASFRFSASANSTGPAIVTAASVSSLDPSSTSTSTTTRFRHHRFFPDDRRAV
ncbi:glycoside hydrolase family 16 protein [Baudoinia panamericana UAMH 10762]|uniref:endo-1,3(4)-beta-glucanase n=1 Tax=Baudoinia panamericana (strain UAMH 10762) TaxID=717646 RepID=M2LLS3_BAUPA|nr:glycoside hydrolase family 16 protein [Baudoinia panamericana UAMH 10762]EMC95257.1 glycoside hydrolase family 16 protein [Baudoinia panamericana UAMH 10762]